MGNAAGLDARPTSAAGDLPHAGGGRALQAQRDPPPRARGREVLRPDAPELSRLAAAGITTVLATPPRVLFKGQSALVNVTAPPDEPQIGGVADPRQGLQVVRAPVALHVALALTGGGRGVAAVSRVAPRRHRVRAPELPRRAASAARGAALREDKTGVTRPNYDPSLDAMQPALARRLPVAFEAELSREILRALDMAKEFKLDPVITGAREADQVVGGSEGAERARDLQPRLSRRGRARCRRTRTSRFASCARARRHRRRPAALAEGRRDVRLLVGGLRSRASSCGTPRAPSRTDCQPDAGATRADDRRRAGSPAPPTAWARSRKERSPTSS